MLSHFDIHIVWTSENFVPEGSVLVFFSYFVDFVDDSTDGGVFVHEDGSDDGFVREVLLAEVEMGSKGLANEM